MKENNKKFIDHLTVQLADEVVGKSWYKGEASEKKLISLIKSKLKKAFIEGSIEGEINLASCCYAHENGLRSILKITKGSLSDDKKVDAILTILYDTLELEESK